MIDFTSPPPSPLPLIIFSLLNFSFQETKQTIFFKFKIPHLSKSMKKSGFFAASVAAASATAISASPSSSTSSFSCNSNMHLSPEVGLVNNHLSGKLKPVNSFFAFLPPVWILCFGCLFTLFSLFFLFGS